MLPISLNAYFPGHDPICSPTRTAAAATLLNLRVDPTQPSPMAPAHIGDDTQQTYFFTPTTTPFAAKPKQRTTKTSIAAGVKPVKAPRAAPKSRHPPFGGGRHNKKPAVNKTGPRQPQLRPGCTVKVGTCQHAKGERFKGKLGTLRKRPNGGSSDPWFYVRFTDNATDDGYVECHFRSSSLTHIPTAEFPVYKAPAASEPTEKPVTRSHDAPSPSLISPGELTHTVSDDTTITPDSSESGDGDDRPFGSPNTVRAACDTLPQEGDLSEEEAKTRRRTVSLEG